MKERRDKDPWVTQAYLCLVDQAENSIIVVLWAITLLSIINPIYSIIGCWRKENNKTASSHLGDDKSFLLFCHWSSLSMYWSHVLKSLSGKHVTLHGINSWKGRQTWLEILLVTKIVAFVPLHCKTFWQQSMRPMKSTNKKIRL